MCVPSLVLTAQAAFLLECRHTTYKFTDATLSHASAMPAWDNNTSKFTAKCTRPQLQLNLSLPPIPRWQHL